MQMHPKVKEHLAIQFNVEGEAAGAFYLEVAEGKGYGTAL